MDCVIRKFSRRWHSQIAFPTVLMFFLVTQESWHLKFFIKSSRERKVLVGSIKVMKEIKVNGMQVSTEGKYDVKSGEKKGSEVAADATQIAFPTVLIVFLVTQVRNCEDESRILNDLHRIT
ncbi:hypothetical protein T03_1192 [Trichinella britovi]|uniref:Uncharacterized protein n=1 Tax=Trichinella britovi TaxID=45882 RepID=A0A0V1D2F3_TRIBR|nr:hypothetical protein T03_1192 [Trichinella britovi]